MFLVLPGGVAGNVALPLVEMCGLGVLDQT
jgi:hypothetical protein